MKITVLNVGSSLLAPLRNAERDINREGIDLRLAIHNFGGVFTNAQWMQIEDDLKHSKIVFVIHVMDGENASRLLPLLDQYRSGSAVIVINCMPELMRRTRSSVPRSSWLAQAISGHWPRLYARSNNAGRNPVVPAIGTALFVKPG